MNRTFAGTLMLLCALALLAGGCEKPYKPVPYLAKPASAPAVIACHDAVGHAPGNKPWILGGKCCCTPTKAAYDRGVAEGTITASMTYDQYMALYSENGISTDMDHKGCGTWCVKAPHVTMGGKCMATPTPGTAIYETITYGPHTNLIAEARK